MRDEREFLAFVASVLNVPASALSCATAYGSLPEWDSVMHLRLTMEIESRYGVEIPFERIAAISTLGEFFSFIGNESKAG